MNIPFGEHREVNMYSSYTSEVDENIKFHRTFELAVKRIIRDSCNIHRKPWGGLIQGDVFECHRFYIYRIEYVLNRKNQKVIVNSQMQLQCYKDWGNSVNPKLKVASGCMCTPELMNRISDGFSRRWKFGWDQVKKHKNKADV